ncbi:MAG TPA: class I SAM-dependent methyltransferase [Solirubrobacteraceae bacterium]|nr:class I SAM-dependent methyltransferase [Solirubrobacteraceae bacterium]
MRPDAYAEMAALEDRHWWFRGRRDLLRALLRRAGVDPRRTRVLDAGCGTGRNLAEFGGVGVDPAPEAVAACRARGLDVVQAPLEALPFGDASFDLLLATDVLEHVDDDVAALRELRRVAAPGALLLVTVPAHPRLWSAHDEALHHRRRYRRAELLARVRAAGWEPVVTTWWNAFLLPPIAAARLVRRRSGGTDHGRTPAWADGLLRLPLALEARLVGRGLRLPAGVSLALACRPGAQADAQA